MRPTLVKACAQRSSPEVRDIVVGGCCNDLQMRRIIGEVLNLGRRDEWFGLLALLLSLLFIHDCPSHCPPFGPTTGLGRDWPLGGSTFAGRRLNLCLRRLYLPTALGRSFHSRNSPAASLRRTMSRFQRLSRDEGWAMNSMTPGFEHLRCNFQNTKISSDPQIPLCVRLLVAPSRSPDPSPPRLSARRKDTILKVNQPITALHG